MVERLCRVTCLLLAVVLAAGSLLLTTVGTAAASADKSPITVAFITSETGVAASETADAPVGFLARVAWQNAEGGVNGHKIVPLVIDDQSSPTTVLSAVQDAISKGAIGIVSGSALFFLAAKYPQQAGLPVTGDIFDGPEWGQKPYTNMFAADAGSVDPQFPVNTVFSSFLRAHGGTVIGSYGYGISPTSSRGATSAERAFESEGGKVGVLDTSIPLGSTAFTPVALVAKQQGVNAVFAAMDNDSNIALATALSQAGVKLKSVVFPTGYGPSLITSPAWKSVQGDYFVSELRPADVPDAGTVQLTDALQKYEHRPSSQFYDASISEAWVGADLMLKGIGMAGANPTSAEVIRSLRSITSYNGDGLDAQSTDYATNFGHDPAKTCLWYLKAEKTAFVPVSTQPWCGKDLPGTSTAG